MGADITQYCVFPLARDHYLCNNTNKGIATVAPRRPSMIRDTAKGEREQRARMQCVSLAMVVKTEATESFVLDYSSYLMDGLNHHVFPYERTDHPKKDGLFGERHLSLQGLEFAPCVVRRLRAESWASPLTPLLS